MFRKIPFILIAILLIIPIVNPFLPLVLKQLMYSFSLSIKALIIALLPFIIFGLLFKASVTLSKQATQILLTILILACCSNFVSTFLSHFVGVWIYHLDIALIAPQTSHSLPALWNFNMPVLIANDKAMFLGIILGLIASRLKPESSLTIIKIFDKIINLTLRGIVFLIPFFVTGFIIKLQEDGLMHTLVKDYSLIFALIALAQFGYILFVYLSLNRFKWSAFKNNIKHMIPAAVSGLSTMSSAVSMPLTLMGTEQNVRNKQIARSVIPATVNIHLVGDCFAIPIFAYAILKSFGVDEPSLMHYLVFVFYFILAKFSVAAVPGGGILVMLPILERHLGFTGEMMSLITALYILFDPVITCANVLGNGAFAKMIDEVTEPRSQDFS